MHHPASRGKAAPAGASLSDVVWRPERVLFEDEWLLVVDKPAGLPTQPTLDPSRASAYSVVQAMLQRRSGGACYLGLHHRLDRDTSGVLLFTKDPAANAGVAALFSGKIIHKTYQALAIAGAAGPETWEVVNHLGEVGRVGKATRYGAVRSGGDRAQTSFRILERLPGALLIEARPQTGRTHQIRVHLAEGRYPIFGDTLYGGATQLKAGAGGGVVRAPRVMLHAAALEFVHPMTTVALAIRSPLPEDFQACLRELRQGAVL